jgi:hypothetical protein
VVDGAIDDLKRSFADGLNEKLQAGAANVSSSSLFCPTVAYTPCSFRPRRLPWPHRMSLLRRCTGRRTALLLGFVSLKTLQLLY